MLPKQMKEIISHQLEPVRVTQKKCRPQSRMKEQELISIPEDLDEEKIIFSSHKMIPKGHIQNIEYVLFVPPKGYFSIPTLSDRTRFERTIGVVNNALKGKVFICIGPGRWGTSTQDLGVHVAYGDIYNTSALIELTGASVGSSPDPSFGTHFFQDMMEAHIFPLAINLDNSKTVFREDFFYSTPNRLQELVPQADPILLNALKIIKVSDFAPGKTLDLIMNDEESRAVCFINTSEDEFI